MPLSIDWPLRDIFVPTSYLTHVSGVFYELDVDQFRKDLLARQDDVDGIIFPDTHRHATEVTLSGVTYARFFEIINNYTVTFEDGQYVVACSGANHNLADVKTPNQVSLVIGNSAGLITVNTGTGPIQVVSTPTEAIEGAIVELETITGTIEEAEVISGFIEDLGAPPAEEELVAAIIEEETITGQLTETEVLVGRFEECSP